MRTFKRVQKFLACIFLTLCICLPLASSALASGADERRTVKVGVLNNTTYADQNEDGTWSGLDIECMISIAQKAGFDVEFIDSSNDPDFLGNLDKGVYDIVADVTKTPEREEKYLFTDEPIGHTTNTLAVRADDDRWDYGNVEQVSQMKIGVIATYANNTDFRAWCVKHRVTPDIVEYTDIEQMTNALMKGEIDGEVYSYNKEYNAKMQTIMKFLPETFYYVFRKNDTNLKNKVDDALAQIFVGNAEYISSLKNKYEDQYNVNVLPFSAEEKDYIAGHPVLSVAVISGDEPCYSAASDGKVSGIIPDYYAMIAENTGIKFEYKEYPTQDAAVEAVKNGETDIVGIFSGGIISSQQYGLMLTDSFSTVNNILMMKSGSNMTQVKSISVRQRAKDSISAVIKKEFPEVETVTYENAQKCFDAMRRGKTSAMLIDLPSATWILNQSNTSAYSIFPMPGVTTDLCGAVDNKNLILCSILNKRIGTTKSSFSGLVTKDTLPKDDWKTTISRVPPAWIILIFGTLMILVIGLMWTLVILGRRQKERAAVLSARAETEKQKIQVDSIRKNAEEQNLFFSNISHDMRTPLNAVLGFIRLAQKDGLSDEQRNDYLAKAESSGTLMLDLINDTLTISKASSGKLELHPSAVSTEIIGESITTPIRTLAAQKNITFIMDKSGYRPRIILADQLGLQKIFLNILNNAIKYTPNGGHIWTTVYDTPKDSPDPDTVFVVRDDGIGISEEFLPHIFEPFTQEKRTGYESVGTGLGLSIVKRIVEQMGGTIEVQSQKDRGSTFTVRLHFTEIKDADAPNSETKRGNFAELSGRKVLLCEDNALNREIAVALLKDRGMNTDTAENGEIGVEKFLRSEAGEYALILMDVRMPVMDGYEATKKIRSLDRPDANSIPIIAMTADAFSEDIKMCLDAGMNGHVAKPIDPQALFKTIQDSIAQ